MVSTFNEYIGLALSAEELHFITDWPDAVIEDYTSLVNSLQALSTAVESSLMLSGSGSPEGSVTANNSRQYFDTAGPALYVNPTAGANTGWVQV